MVQVSGNALKPTRYALLVTRRPSANTGESLDSFLCHECSIGEQMICSHASLNASMWLTQFLAGTLFMLYNKVDTITRQDRIIVWKSRTQTTLTLTLTRTSTTIGYP